MKGLPQSLRWYLSAVFICALVVASIAFYLSPLLGKEKGWSFPLFLVFISLVSFLSVRYNGRMMLSLATTVSVAAAWILLPFEVIVIIIWGCVFREVGRITWYKAIFNICQDTIIVGGTAILFSFIAVPPVPHSWIQVFLIGIVGMFYTGTSVGLLGTVITLSNPAGYNYKLWKQNVLGVFTYIDVTLFMCGIVLGVLWFVSIQAFVLGLVLLSTLYWSLRSNADVHQASTHRRQVQEALNSMLAPTNVGQQIELLLKQLWNLFPIERACAVLFEDDNQDEPVIVARSDAHDLHAICSRPDTLRDLCAQRSIRRIEHEPAYAEHCTLPTHLIPLHTSEKIIGAMVIVLRKNTRDVPDFRLLATYAAQATLAVVQAQLINNLQASQQQLVRAERLAAVGTLAASVAHEFNNVLAIICNTAEAAALQSNSAAHRRALNIVSTTAKRGRSITHGLLTFTRQITPRREVVHIEDALQPVLDLLATRFKNNQITVVKELSPVSTLIGDVGLLSQAVLNIITNALDAMPTGGTLTITLWQDQQTIRLRVQDTGIGIPDEIRAKLFEPFTTTKHAAQETLGGNGLGLAITYGIVTSHQGTVEVESGVDCGTIMQISLPVAEHSPAPILPVPASQQVDGPLRVIVVDDEPLIAMALAQTLEHYGHQVAWFDDPEQARTMITEQAPDLLIADIHMPKLDGPTLLRQAKDQHPAMRQILISGQMQAHQRAEVLALGVEVLYKPVSGTDIHTLLGYSGAFTPTRAMTEEAEHPLIPNEQEHILRDALRHRLMNHVSGLEGMFRVIRRSAADPTVQARTMRYLAQTIGELSVFVRAQRVLGLLDQTSTGVPFIPVPLRLVVLLEEAADWIRAGHLEHERITLTVACPASLEIVADSKSLLAALLAALHNSHQSIRRSGAGDHTITITANRDGNYTIVTVEDTGAGFPLALLDQMRRDLGSGDGEHLVGALQQQHGLGLGIALMFQIARLHGGSVAFGNRQAGIGAWVQFKLPVQTPTPTVVNQGVQATLNAVVA